MRFDGNRSLRNLNFFFEIEIFRQYKVSVFVGGLTPSPGSKYPLGMRIFLDGYLSRELISTSKPNGWTLYLEQFETKLSIFIILNTLISLNFCANKWETICMMGNWAETNLCQLVLIFFNQMTLLNWTDFLQFCIKIDYYGLEWKNFFNN